MRCLWTDYFPLETHTVCLWSGLSASILAPVSELSAVPPPPYATTPFTDVLFNRLTIPVARFFYAFSGPVMHFRLLIRFPPLHYRRRHPLPQTNFVQMLFFGLEHFFLLLEQFPFSPSPSRTMRFDASAIFLGDSIRNPSPVLERTLRSCSQFFPAPNAGFPYPGGCKEGLGP